MITRFVTVFCVFRSLCEDLEVLCFGATAAVAVASELVACHDVTSFEPFIVSPTGGAVVGILLLLFFFECLSFAADEVVSAELRLCK